MYDFQKSRQMIIREAKNYGVTVTIQDNGSLHGLLQFSGDYRGSESVQKTLERKISAYNKHAKQGF